MSSTQRNDNTLAVLGSRLVRCMEKEPEMTLGQIIYRALQEKRAEPEPDHEPLDVAINLRRMTNTQFVEALERFVCTG